MPEPTSAPGRTAELIRHEEQASLSTEWVQDRTMRISRRIVTEIQTIEVEVRREELVLDEQPVPDDATVLPNGTAPAAGPSKVFVLYREVPAVSLEVEPYERVTLGTEVVREDRRLDLDLQRERIDEIRAGS